MANRRIACSDPPWRPAGALQRHGTMTMHAADLSGLWWSRSPLPWTSAPGGDRWQPRGFGALRPGGGGISEPSGVGRAGDPSCSDCLQKVQIGLDPACLMIAMLQVLARAQTGSRCWLESSEMRVTRISAGFWTARCRCGSLGTASNQSSIHLERTFRLQV
jgi:hypothetical protein